MITKTFKLAICSIFSFLFISLICSAQQSVSDKKQIDSLLHIIQVKCHDTIRVQAFLTLSEFVAVTNIDSVIPLCEKARDISVKNLVSKKISKAEKYIFKKSLSTAFNNLGYVYERKGNILKAIELYNSSLSIDEEINDKEGMAFSYNNLGMVYLDQNVRKKALEYYTKSLKIAKEINHKNGMANALNNIGMFYHDDGNYKKALEYFNQCINIQKEIGNTYGVAQSYSNIGISYYKMNHPNMALEYYLQSLKIKKEIDDKEGVSISYINIGSIYFDKHNFSEAKRYYQMALDLGKKIGYPGIIKNAAKYLSLVYKKEKKYKTGWEVYELYIKMQDSIHNQETVKATLKQNMRYEYEKQHMSDSIVHVKQIQIKNLDISQQKELNKKQSIIIYVFLAAFIIIAIFSFIIYSMFQQKKKANLAISQKNNELEQANEEISTQRDEIEAQRDLVTNQKLHIEEIHKEVTDSINYATRIQSAILPGVETLCNYLSETFILFKPKDKVSGDFYWWAVVEKQLVITVADCTGHGVPGAFMSMLGSSLLREIVVKEYMTNPAIILKRLRKEIINSLKQKGETGEQKDGMDISLLVVNTETNECQWAGANNPLYIVRGGQNPQGLTKPEPLQNLEGLEEIKGDKMPIAIYERMEPFTNHEFKVEKGDMLYLFSDGFADQFGGPKNKKFGYKQFKEVILTNADKPMAEQNNIIEKSLNEWIDNVEQIDDITVLGIRIQ